MTTFNKYQTPFEEDIEMLLSLQQYARGRDPPLPNIFLVKAVAVFHVVKIEDKSVLTALLPLFNKTGQDCPLTLGSEFQGGNHGC